MIFSGIDETKIRGDRKENTIARCSHSTGMFSTVKAFRMWLGLSLDGTLSESSF